MPTLRFDITSIINNVSIEVMREGYDYDEGVVFEDLGNIDYSPPDKRYVFTPDNNIMYDKAQPDEMLLINYIVDKLNTV